MATLYWTDKRGRKWPACECLIEWLTAYQNELLRRGVIRESIDVYQLIGDAPASAGVHKYGGCYDIAQKSTEALWVARNMGSAAWGRDNDPNDGQPDMDNHQHGVLVGCPHNVNARYQIPALQANRNGLGRNGMGGPDDGPRTGVQFPLRTYKQGIAWAKAQNDPMEEIMGWYANKEEFEAAIANAVLGSDTIKVEEPAPIDISNIEINPEWKFRAVLTNILKGVVDIQRRVTKLESGADPKA